MAGRQVGAPSGLRRGDGSGRFGGDAACGLHPDPCLLYTSDAADERSSVDLGGRRIIKKKKQSHAMQEETVRPE